jgi:hypothetical protein
MAEINKLIEIGDYKFELTLKSKSVHAHSLMTDYNSLINSFIGEKGDAQEETFYDYLYDITKQHKEIKKL